MNTCKTCKHWSPHHGTWSPSEVTRTCARIPHGTQESKGPNYDEYVIIDDDEEPIPPNGAAACDGSGYVGWVVTGPDFGCVLHEETE